MPGRHDAPVPGRSRWAPTALNALVAVTPATSLATAFGLAGGGYLTGREGVAACGALAGAFGLVVERLQARSVRVRLRRERSRHRRDLGEVSRLLHDVQRDLAGLRADLDDVRSERDSVRAELRATLDRVAVAEKGAAVAVPVPVTEPVVERVETPVVERAEAPVEEPAADVVPELAAEPVGEPVGDESVDDELRELARPMPLALLVPGQVRSPIATGGIPVLPPGPRELVRSIDLRTPRADADDETQPLPVMTAELADALVYAAMAEADAAQLTRVLEGPDAAGRHAGPLHTGDAHHAGDYTRERPMADSAPTLYIVRRGKHVA